MALQKDENKNVISRRAFARMAGAVPLVGIVRAGFAHETKRPAQAASDATLPDLKPHPALTADQAAKLDEALGRLAGQLGQLRKHTLPYSAEPAFTFRAEVPRRAAPAPAATGKG